MWCVSTPATFAARNEYIRGALHKLANCLDFFKLGLGVFGEFASLGLNGSGGLRFRIANSDIQRATSPNRLAVGCPPLKWLAENN